LYFRKPLGIYQDFVLDAAAPPPEVPPEVVELVRAPSVVINPSRKAVSKLFRVVTAVIVSTAL
jgi:hypothetical protein